MSSEKKGTPAIVIKEGNKTIYKCGKKKGAKKETIKTVKKQEAENA